MKIKTWNQLQKITIPSEQRSSLLPPSFLKKEKSFGDLEKVDDPTQSSFKIMSTVDQKGTLIETKSNSSLGIIPTKYVHQ